jgi:uracil-DNA glycosylase
MELVVTTVTTALDELVNQVRLCRICRDHPRGRPLPHEPNPVLRPSATARILIAGQAPGVRVHASGLPFTDPSGDRLREWMGVDREVFYDVSRIAILPMGFCFPGHDSKGGDLPPRRECALAWRAELMALMPRIDLVICLGAHALKWHLGETWTGRLSDAVTGWRQGLALPLPVAALPHPSWRNNAWLKANPWFARDLLPVLRREVKARLR